MPDPQGNKNQTAYYGSAEKGGGRRGGGRNTFRTMAVCRCSLGYVRLPAEPCKGAIRRTADPRVRLSNPAGGIRHTHTHTPGIKSLLNKQSRDSFLFVTHIYAPLLPMLTFSFPSPPCLAYGT